MAACLQQLGGSPERVLNALLEGSLPAQLAKLDTQLSFAAWQAAAPKASGAAAGSDKGKGKAAAAPTYDSEFPAALPGAWAGGSGCAAGASRAGSSSTADALARAARAENKTARWVAGGWGPGESQRMRLAPYMSACVALGLCTMRLHCPVQQGGCARLQDSQSGYFLTCQNVHGLVRCRYLDVRDETYREALLSAAAAAQVMPP